MWGDTIGTDVYLNWQGKTKEDQEKQCTGWSIDAGDVGYLRASIGMQTENKILRMIFPEKYWMPNQHIENSDDFDWESYNGFEYDFISNTPRLKDLLTAYVDGENITVESESYEQQNGLGNRVRELFANMGFELIEGESEDLEGRKMWARSIVNFFKLGCELQSQGKHPRVEISW